KNEGYAYRSESSKNWVLLDENIRSNQPIKLQFGQYGIASRPMWGNLPVQGEAMEDAATEGELQPTQTAVPQETLEKTKGEVEEQPASSPTREMEEEIECRISFIEKQKEKEEGIQRRRIPAANTDAETDPYTYSAEKEYVAVEYSNAFGENTILRLTPTSEGYKEDIILSERPVQESFSFELNVTGGLVLELDENNVVWMKDADTQEVIGSLPQPYMEDSSSLEEGVNDSTDILVTLEEKGNGKYLYTLVPNQTWLNADTTVYPVKIDPSTTISGSNQKDKDVTDTGTAYNNTYQYLRVGRDSNGHRYRSYLQFTLPNDLAGSYVTAATLYTYQTYSGSSSPTFAIHRVNGSWTSAGITWSNQPSFSSGSYASQAVSAVKDYTWNMRTMVQEWANGTENNGLVIKAVDETAKRYKRFASSDNSSNKPRLSIVYYPVNLTINASASAGALNSSQGSINVSWVAPPSGVTAKVVLDGKEYSPNNANGANTHKFSGVSSYVSHKVKVRFTGTNFDRSTAEKTVKLEDRTPPIFNTSSEVSVSDGNLNIRFAPALKPNSVKNVAFPVWTAQDGQDDVIWHQGINSGNGTWTATVRIADHKNETGAYILHCYATTADGITDYFGNTNFDLDSDQLSWTGYASANGKTGRGLRRRSR
ncbi:MAG: DNRLRE domain-containing protein, partial [Acutalibacteraceae bacterium]